MKKIFSIITLILIAFTVVGCTPNNPGSNNNPGNQNQNDNGVGGLEEIYE